MDLTSVQIAFIVIWSLIALVSITIEIFATNFIALWFSGGSVVALVLLAVNLDWYYQLIAFVGVSGTTLAIFYPLLRRKLLHRKVVPTNISTYIGRKIKITKIIENNLDVHGYALLSGVLWSVKAIKPDVSLNKNDIVIIKAVKGTTLLVDQLKENNNHD